MSNLTTDRDPSDESKEAELRPLIDCADLLTTRGRGWRRALFIVCGMIVFIPIIILVGSLATTRFPALKDVLLGFLFLSILGGMYYLHYAAGQRAKAVIERAPAPLCRATIVEACATGWFGWGTHLKAVAPALVARGCKGIAVRVCHPEGMRTIHALALQFEPIPLDESVALFLGMESGNGGYVHETDVPSDSAEAAESGEFRRWMKRNVLLSGGWVILVIFGFNVVIAAIESLQRRKVTARLIQWTFFFMLMLFGLGGRGAWRSHRQWLLVPGGLAVRRARFFKKDWDLHLFARAESVLIVRHEQRHIWRAHVADAANHATAGMTSREATMLLRAWLCPLPTPPLECLTDLT